MTAKPTKALNGTSNSPTHTRKAGTNVARSTNGGNGGKSTGAKTKASTPETTKTIFVSAFADNWYPRAVKNLYSQTSSDAAAPMIKIWTSLNSISFLLFRKQK